LRASAAAWETAFAVSDGLGRRKQDGPPRGSVAVSAGHRFPPVTRVTGVSHKAPHHLPRLRRTVSNVWNEMDALSLADGHCAKHGKSARFTHMEAASALYDCVKSWKYCNTKPTNTISSSGPSFYPLVAHLSHRRHYGRRLAAPIKFLAGINKQGGTATPHLMGNRSTFLPRRSR
jgi:hypothetical protein